MSTGVGTKIAAICLSILLPLSVIFAIPLYIIRYLVAQLAKLIYWRKVRKILTTGCSFYGIDDIYNYPKSAILVGITFEEPLSFVHLRNTFQTRVVDSEFPNNGGLRYPELKEYVFPWFGYLFWRAEEDFKIEDHVRLHVPVLNESAVFQLGATWIHRPFPVGQSPWEFVLVPHTETPHCTALLRIHHAIGDGMSIIKMFNQMVDGGKMPMPSPNFSSGKSIWKKLALPFLAAYDLSLQSLQPLDVNSWHLPVEKLTRNPNTHLSPHISMKLIKDIRNITKSSSAGVLLTGFAGGLRKFMLKNNFVVPEFITAGAALPYPGHPEKMRNHLTAIFVPLPLGDMDPRERLAAIETSFEELRHSNLPIASFYGLKLNGALPTPIIRRTASQYSPTSGFANFPGPVQEVSFAQQRITSIWATGGFPQRAGVTCCVLGYKGDFRLSIAIDDGIVPQCIPASDLVDLILQEIIGLNSAKSIA